MDKIEGIIEIMPETSSKRDEDIAMGQKKLVDEITGLQDNGIIDKLIEEEIKAMLKK